MRILTISSLFPPHVVGGAEMSAWNFARWLRDEGHEVGVLTVADDDGDVIDDEMVDGMRIWRVKTPHIYPMTQFLKAPGWKKPLWHLQDHLDPRNEATLARVLETFKPDHANVHISQGLGHNALKSFRNHDVSVVMFLHDLTVACIKTSMYKNGENCAKQCPPCLLSSKMKYSFLKDIRRLGFCSPSRANLDTVSRFFPIRNFKNTDILDANKYPAPTVERQESARLRILYAGRIHTTKGTDMLLQALAELAPDHDFSITIAGGGPDEPALRERYGNEPWCRFAGFIPQTELSNLMVDSDVLCVPSIWAENSPGVAIQALSLGLPVLASNKGGLPELVDDGRNGALLPPGDIAAWKEMLAGLMTDGSRITGWRAYAAETRARFEQDNIARRLLAFINDVRGENG